MFDGIHLLTICSISTLFVPVANSQGLAENAVARNTDKPNSTGGTEPVSNRVRVVCETQSMCVHLNKRWLQSRWRITDIHHLTMKRSCDLTKTDTESEFILCTPKAKLMSCGNEIEQNDTHVAFLNTVYATYRLAPGFNISILKAEIPWKCTYPLELLVGAQYLPEISPVTIFRLNKSATGEFAAAMFLYKDDGYRNAYSSVPQLRGDDKLRVKVQLLRGPRNSNLQVVKCWGTSGDYPQIGYESYTLINDFCPVASAGVGVRIQNNGDKLHSLWESRVFRFAIDPKVFLHCHVRVCFDGNKCKKDCGETNKDPKRARREVQDSKYETLTLGPLKMGQDVSNIVGMGKARSHQIDTKDNLSTISPKTEETLLLGMPKTVTFILIGGLALICILLIIGASIVIRRKMRDRKSTTEKFWQEQLANRQQLSKTFTLSNGPPFEIPISLSNTLASAYKSERGK